MKRLSLVFILLSSILLSACKTTPNPTPSPSLETKPQNLESTQDSQDISYYTEKPNTKGYLARPEGEGPFPALILIHEWWGLNDNMRELVRDFASEGYIALAVDLYDGQSATDSAQAGSLAGSVRENPEEAQKNLQAAVAYLKTLGYVDQSKLASVGWCFGGGWSYMMAKNDLGVKASVMYYGQFNEKDDLSHMKAMIQGHFGADDQSIAVDDVKAFQAKLKTLSGEHEVYIYENAGHGFANEDNASAYKPESAKEAWDRTLAFLSKVMDK